MQTWLPTYNGVRGFYIFNLYGHVGAGPKNLQAYNLNGKFQLTSSSTTLGDLPIIVLGDYQTNPDESYALGSLTHHCSWHAKMPCFRMCASSGIPVCLATVLCNFVWDFRSRWTTNTFTGLRRRLQLCSQLAMIPFVTSWKSMSGLHNNKLFWTFWMVVTLMRLSTSGPPRARPTAFTLPVTKRSPLTKSILAEDVTLRL